MVPAPRLSPRQPGSMTAGRWLDSIRRLGGDRGFLLSGGIFSAFDFPGALSTDAFGINASAQIVGQYLVVGGGPFHGFLRSGGIFSTLDFPGSTSTTASGINDSGLVVGSSGFGGATHGFLLDRGIFTALDFPGSSATLASGINDSGQVVGFYQTGGVQHGFLATPTTPTIPEPGTLGSAATALGLMAAWTWRRRRHP